MWKCFGTCHGFHVSSLPVANALLTSFDSMFPAFLVSFLFCFCLRYAKLKKNEMGAKQADPEVAPWQAKNRKVHHCGLVGINHQFRLAEVVSVAPAPRLNYEQG